jgi:hypothetical protein
MQSRRVKPHLELSARGEKAFEVFIFGPCTLVRTWGTHPDRLALIF